MSLRSVDNGANALLMNVNREGGYVGLILKNILNRIS